MLRLLLTLVVVITIVAIDAPVHAQDELTLPDESLFTDPVFARPGMAGVAQPYLNRTRYLLAIDLDSATGQMRGQARILFVNRAYVAVDRVILRLYQNHPKHGGRRTDVLDLAVNGAPTQGQFLDTDRTIFSVPLGAVVQPGAGATIDMRYTISVEGGGFYYVSEPYPIVAVFDASGWRQDVGTNSLDYAYTESALHVVKLRVSANYATYFVGMPKTVEQSPDGSKTTYTIVTGPVRNFIIVQGRGWRDMTISGASVPIRIAFSGRQAAAEEIGQIAVAAFNFYENQFGIYPYAELDIVSMVFSSGGEEYPNILFINNERDSVYRRFITAHEVGHQWFYGIAGNDTLNNAWLDESMTQYAGYLFYKYTQYGGANSAETYWASILTWYNRLQTVRPLNTPMTGYRDFNDFMSNIYGGGAVFLRELGEKIGDQAMMAGMKAYVQNVYLGIGTLEQFYLSVQAQTTIDLSDLFCQRVGVGCR
ncbi:MAG: hypothetical protein KF726_25915 [Anaerolineae bacterium]|nr:hypothetical protein [Anaerolineae bacterium]